MLPAQPLSQELMGRRCFIKVCSQGTPCRTGGNPERPEPCQGGLSWPLRRVWQVGVPL